MFVGLVFIGKYFAPEGLSQHFGTLPGGGELIAFTLEWLRPAACLSFLSYLLKAHHIFAGVVLHVLLEAIFVFQAATPTPSGGPPSWW